VTEEVDYTLVCHPTQKDVISSILDEFPDREVEVLISNYIDPEVAFLWIWREQDFTDVPFKIHRLAPPPEDGVGS
jgi:ABC-type iron transport system FetAB ATPase subunit